MAENVMTVEKAAEILGQGFHCSQCVFSHTAERFGIDKSTALKMTAGLGGGCFHGNVCGAVTAAVITLGLAYGFDKPNSAEQNAILVEKVHEFENRFIEKHGSIICKDLLGGWDFAKPDEAKKIMTEGLTKNCPTFCADACAILDDMLKDVAKK